jgi:ribonuclease PH
MGRTKVICSVIFQDEVPRWFKDQSQGWATCEYDMLPGATSPRNTRDSARGKVNSRSSEIQRLIGRSVRSVLDLKKIPGRTIWIDCDVLQADGGTRTAAINGAYVALRRAVNRLMADGRLINDPLRDSLAAISVGISGEALLLDLDYQEDSRAEADMNVVMCGAGHFVEVQATGEKRPFTEKEFLAALDLAKKGIAQIAEKQEKAIHENPDRHK